MVRKEIAAAFVVLAVAAAAPAQTGPRYRWQAGQVLVYKVEHATQVIDSVGDAKVEMKAQINETKRWQVLAVDNDGVATLQLSLSALRIEQTTPSGDVLRFDSADLEKSDPDMRKGLSNFVGQPLAVVRMDVWGRVVEVKDAKGPATSLENELPFVVTLPAAMPQANQAWERAYKITLKPPQGTGETYDAVQRYTCKNATADALTVALATEIKKQPEAVNDRIPLLQSQPEGEIVFDLQAGRMRSATLKIDKELKGHQGEGSSYRFVSNYTEQYVGEK
jgi:hypothetical protein